MSRSILVTALLAALLTALVCQAATEAPNAGCVNIDYSLSTSQMAKQTMQGVIFFSGNKARVEQQGMPGFLGTPSEGGDEKLKNVVIVDGDAMEAYAIIPGMNYAIKFKLSNPAFAEGSPAGNPIMMLDPEKYPEGANISKTGTRKYQGATVTVYAVTYEHEGRVTTSKVYVNAQGLPLYMQGKTGSISYEAVLSNYRFGKQDPSLFRLPAGMHVMDLSQYERALSGMAR